MSKLTGDQSLMLHKAKENDRERMRELVINSYHRVKDDQENRAPLIAFTSLNIGRDDMMERSRMR